MCYPNAKLGYPQQYQQTLQHKLQPSKTITRGKSTHSVTIPYNDNSDGALSVDEHYDAKT